MRKSEGYLTMNEEALFLNWCSSFFCLDAALSAAAAAATRRRFAIAKRVASHSRHSNLGGCLFGLLVQQAAPADPEALAYRSVAISSLVSHHHHKKIHLTQNVSSLR